MNNNMISRLSHNHTRIHPVSASGQQITLSDTVNAPLDSCTVSGNSEMQAAWRGKNGLLTQAQTVQGKNLWRPNVAFPITYRDLTVDYDPSNQEYILNGSSDSTHIKIFIGAFDSFKSGDTVAFRLELVSGTILKDSFHTGIVSAGAYNDIGGNAWVGGGAFVSNGTPKSSVIQTLTKDGMTYAILWVYQAQVFTNVRLRIQLERSDIATAWSPFVPDSPSHDYPSPVISTIPAGNYKIACPAGGWWLLNLSDDLRGIGDYKDKIEADVLIGKGKLKTNIIKQSFNGTEAFIKYDAFNGFYLNIQGAPNTWNSLCSHCTTGASNTTPLILFVEGILRFYGWQVLFPTLDTFKAFFAAQYSAGTPITVYYVTSTETVTNLTLTHADTSDLPELVLDDLGIVAPTSGYPFTSVDSEGVLSTTDQSGQTVSSITIPKLAKISDSDLIEYIGSGQWRKTKKISDWIELTGLNMGNANAVQIPLTGCRNMYSGVLDTAPFARSACTGIKWDSAMLTPVISLTSENACSSFPDEKRLYVTANMYDTGWSNTISPTTDEVKAYFYGWKMCHADGSSPYYKSEVPYTPSTWAEWETFNQNIVKESTGLTLEGIGDGNTIRFVRSSLTSIKSSTKYLFLYNIVASSLSVNRLILGGGGSSGAFLDVVSPTVIGNNKVIFTSKDSLSSTSTRVYIQNNGSALESVKIKDIRIFELPTDSQIKADANNLTADQLAAKYPFQGLCIKNWKHVTDGLGLTSVLPTATYEGYTPYKMRYELATPEVTEVELSELRSKFGTTVLSSTGAVPPDIYATVKCLGI